MQWVVDAYTLALASTVLSAGFLADRLGRRRLFTIGLSLFTLASLACAAAQDIGMLNAARAVQSLGAAIMFAVSLALLANAFPDPKERAGAFAAYGAAIGASFAVGPLVGGVLTSGLDWQWIFLVNLPIGAFCLWITRRYVQESRDPAWHRIDWPGQATLTAGLFLLVRALLRGNEQGWTSTAIVVELSAAVVALAAFAISASFFAVFLYVTLYLQRILGMSAIGAGLVYVPATLVSVVVSGATAQLGAKVPARTMISVGLGLVSAGMVLGLLAGVTSSWLLLMPSLMVGLIGTGMFNPARSNVALSVLPADRSGVAAGVNDTFRQAGIAVGVAALGALIPAQNALGGGSPQAYVDGLHHALLAGAALAAAGAIASWFLISTRFGAAAETPVEEVEAHLAAEPIPVPA